MNTIMVSWRKELLIWLFVGFCLLVCPFLFVTVFWSTHLCYII